MSDEDIRMEAILGQYRPVGPPAELRDRVLQAAEHRRSRWGLVGGLSVAAMLILSLGMHLATRHTVRKISQTIRTPRVEWTAQAEEAVQLLGDGTTGRRYIAMGLAAGVPRSRGRLNHDAAANVQGGLP